MSDGITTPAAAVTSFFSGARHIYRQTMIVFHPNIIIIVAPLQFHYDAEHKHKQLCR